jgi:hypothetical protein
MLIPLRIPPGLVISGTQYQSKGFWFNANLIRFFERSIRPVGGWQLVTTVDGVPRGLHAWRSNDGAARLIIGTGSKVYAYVDGTIVEITPTGFTADPPDTYTPSKYGKGKYGQGQYGSNVSAPSDPVEHSIPLTRDDGATWVFDNFGELPVGVMSSDQLIRSWDLDTSDDFEAVSGAPECRAVVATPERFLLALGASTSAEGFLVFSDVPSDGDTVTIGSTVYTFRTMISTTAGDVLIGDTVEGSIANLTAAINQAAGGGTLYGSLTVAHTDVRAKDASATFTLIVTAIATGTSGNGITLSTTASMAVWTSAATFGGAANPTNVRWPSRETLTDWTPTSTNTAGDFPVTTVGQFMNGKRMPRETLLWTNADLHAAVYVGGDAIYVFEWRGDKCGAIAPNAMSVIGDTAYWMSDNGFFRYDGRVSEIPCDVHDFIFSRLNKARAQRVYAVSLSQFSEVWWFYPSVNSDDVDSYVVYNYQENHWTIGTLVRTAGVDRGVFTAPVMADKDGNIWHHEVGSLRQGADPVFLESGPVEIQDGNNVWMLRRIVPDEANLGKTEVFVGGSLWPTDPVTFQGPLNPEAPTSVRLTARQIRFRIQESAINQDFRIGLYRVDAVACGER